MVKEGQGSTLGEVAVSFLTTLPPQEREDSSREVNRFVLWYGKEQSVSQLTPVVVGNYAEWVAASALDAPSKLEPVKKFLSYAKKEGLIKTNLATHLRIKKASPKTSRKVRRTVLSQSYAELKSQIVASEVKRQRAIEGMHRAANEDLQENATPQGVIEHPEQVDAQVGEIGATIEVAEVFSEKPADMLRVRPGCRVILIDLSSGERLSYTLANASEVRLTQNVLSIASPIGKALLNRGEGDTVEVTAPIGKLRYQIEGIELPGRQT